MGGPVSCQFSIKLTRIYKLVLLYEYNAPILEASIRTTSPTAYIADCALNADSGDPSFVASAKGAKSAKSAKSSPLKTSDARWVIAPLFGPQIVRSSEQAPSQDPTVSDIYRT